MCHERDLFNRTLLVVTVRRAIGLTQREHDVGLVK